MSPSEPLRVTTSRRRRRTAIALLTFAFALSQFYRTCLAVMAPELQHDLGLSPEGFGALSSCFFLSFGLAQIPVGVLFDRLGVGRPTAALLLVGTLSAVLFTFASSGPQAMIAQVGLGLACAPVFMGLLHYAAEILDEADYAKLVSRSNGTGMLGALIATAPLGWASMQFGWRVSMGVAALCMAAACIGVWTTVRDQGHAEARGRSLGSMCLTSLRLLEIRALWTLLPMCVAMAAGTAFRNAWGGPYLSHVFHMNAEVRGLGLAFVSFSAFCTAFVLPGLVRRFDLKPTIGAWSTLSLLAGAALTFFPSANPYLAVGLMAALASIGMLHPILMAHGRKLFHPSMRGRGLGVMNTFVFLGAAVASWAFGAIAGFGTASGWSASSTYSLIFAVASLTIVAALIPYRVSPR
nr:MFS transporter [Rhodopseudomonas palustris]